MGLYTSLQIYPSPQLFYRLVFHIFNTRSDGQKLVSPRVKLEAQIQALNRDFGNNLDYEERQIVYTSEGSFNPIYSLIWISEFCLAVRPILMGAYQY